MSNFKIVNNISEVHSNNGWIDFVNFKSKNKIVDGNGQPVAADYAGRRYQLIAKQERKFSKWERFTRSLLGAWIVIRSFGYEWSSKTVKNFFKKDHESRRFGKLINPLNEIEPDVTRSDFVNIFPQELSLEIFS